MTEASKSQFHITLSIAQQASRHALDEIEYRTGCKFIPEVKGSLAKHLTGILAHAELQSGFLTHAGIEKQLKNQIMRPPAKRVIRKRWKGREEAA